MCFINRSQATLLQPDCRVTVSLSRRQMLSLSNNDYVKFVIESAMTKTFNVFTYRYLYSTFNDFRKLSHLKIKALILAHKY